MLLYPLDFAQMMMEDWIAFCLGVLFAITVHAEAQAVMAALFGDARPSPTDRFHFNPLFHLDIAGTLAFAAAGFGWPRWISVDHSRLRHPRIASVFIRLSGPAANLLLGSIASNVAFLLGALFSLEPHMFHMVMGVNFNVALFHLLPLPPLAMAAVPAALLPKAMHDGYRRLRPWLPYALVLVLVLDRWEGWGWVAAYQRAMVLPVIDFFIKY